MARTALTVIDCPTKWATVPIEVTWTAADNANGNEFDFTGCELLLVRNDNVGAQTVTVSSVADSYGRTGDQTKNIPSGDYYVFGAPFPAMGWEQADQKIYVDAGAADVYLAVIRITK